MTQKTIQQKIRQIAESKEDAEKLKEMLPFWREAYKQAMEAAEKSFIALVFFFLVFVLIDTAALAKANFFGLEFKDLSIPYVLVFALSFATYYRFILLGCFAQMVEECIRAVHIQYYKNFQICGLSDLSVYPSVPQIELTFINIEDNEAGLFARIAGIFVLAEGLGLLMIPWFGMGWASYALIRSTLVSKVVAVSLVSVSWVIAIRTFLTFIQSIRHHT